MEASLSATPASRGALCNTPSSFVEGICCPTSIIGESRDSGQDPSFDEKEDNGNLGQFPNNSGASYRRDPRLKIWARFGRVSITLPPSEPGVEIHLVTL